MKFSNIWNAGKSTIIGLLITILTALAQALTAGPIDWKVLGTVILSSVILALTDILRETKTTLHP
jgi:hypothetical protein